MRTDKTLKIRGPLLAGTLAFGALALSACGSNVTTTADPPTTAARLTTATTTSASSTSTAPAAIEPTTAVSTSGTVTTAPSSGGVAVGGTPACSAGDLVVSLGPVTGAAGTSGVAVVFRNNSLGNCSLSGYPGVDGLAEIGPASSPTAHIPATRSSGGTPVTTVVIDPSQEASALILASNVPTGTATSCPSFTGLVVTPPNTRVSTRLPGALRDCDGLEVRPIVAGSTGS